MARRIEVEIVGDSRSLERAFDRSARSAKKFEANISGVGSSFGRVFAGGAAAIGATVGVRALFDGLNDAVDAASDMNEAMSKSNAVFGESAREITKWSETTATAFGLSQREAVETASSFGALFKPLGIAGQEAVTQSRRLTELGADLASFYNTDVTSALEAIRSGIVGESEPLRRYGALLSETRVVEEALSETHKEHASELTNQEKALARIKIIFEDTAVAQGDFSKTSDGLANQSKILHAQFEDLKVELGEALLPAILDVTEAMNDWLADPENKAKVVDTFTSTVYGLAKAAEFTAGWFVKLRKAWGDYWDALPNWAGGGKKGLVGDVGGGGNFDAFGMPTGGPGAGTTGGGTAGHKPEFATWLNDYVDGVTKFVNKWVEVGRKAKVAADASKAVQAAAFDATRGLDTSGLGGLPFLSVGGINAAMAGRAEQAQFRALGFTGAGDARTPGLKNLRNRRKSLLGRIKGTALDTPATRGMLGRIGAVLAGAAGLPIGRNVAFRIREMLDELAESLGDTSSKVGITGRGGISAQKLAVDLGQGLNLTGLGQKTLRQNIAGNRGRVDLHSSVVIDGREVGRAVHKDAVKTAHRTARQTSGWQQRG